MAEPGGLNMATVALSTILSLVFVSVIGFAYVENRVKHLQYQLDALQSDCRRVVAMEDHIDEQFSRIRYRIDVMGVKVLGRRRWNKRTADD